jgi:ribose transport system permease protein
MSSSVTSLSTGSALRHRVGRLIFRNSLLFGFGAVFIFLAFAAPGFLSWNNIVSVLLNEFTLAAIVSLGMTVVISAGGIDLSVGSAVDIASLVFISSIAANLTFPVALIGGLGGALAVGALNATLVAGVRISPLLATLGTLFISTSIQQLATNGGQPIYLISGTLPEAFSFLARGQFLGIPVQLYVVAVVSAAFFALLHLSRFGRYVKTFGAQPGVAWYSGIPVGRISAFVYIIASLVCGVSGVLLSVTVKAYVPQSGNAYLLGAIGATFIGTTLHPEGKPSVPGTLLGVLLLSIVRNGLLLIGWNFYWQQVATGILIFAVLAFSARSNREGKVV